MGTLNREGYQKLIDEDIAELEKHMSKHSLEMKHAILVLQWSVRQIYGCIGDSHEWIKIDVDKLRCKYCHKIIHSKSTTIV